MIHKLFINKEIKIQMIHNNLFNYKENKLILK